MKKTVVFLLCLLVTSGCGEDRGSKDKAAVPVRVMKVERRTLTKFLEYVGNVKGQDEAVVYPKVSGKIIEKVKEDGSPIDKGEPIAYVDRDEVGLKFEKAPVESPLKGMVGRVYVDIGSSVTTGTPIALVTDMDKAEIDLDVPEKYMQKISLGQEAWITVDAYPEDIFTGKVVKISPVVDLQTRAAPIQIVIDNKDHRLHSGMFAKVKLVIEEERDAPVILKEAIVGRPPDTYIYVVEGKKASFKKITLGIRQGPYFAVKEGVKELDLVVVMGQQKLRDGATVEVEGEKR